MRRAIVSILAVMCLLTPAAFAGDEQGAIGLQTRRIATGLSGALYATSPPGDFERLFIVEQTTARIRILKNGALLATPFIDLNSIAGSGSERGLLGLAFHPDYANNGYFFVNYTDNSGDTRVARYTVSANPDIADPGSAKQILFVDQPFSNHNGGCIQFGPDGYLYVGMGDGGSANDPGNRSQNGTSLHGKMLRLDIDSVGPYNIPATNPFVGNPSFRDEIWAYGLRNPWRFSFDRENGDIYIGDVGQNAREEVSWQPGSSTGGENYGWRCMEGLNCTGLSGCTCNDSSLTLPIHQYVNGGSNCSITGGYNYRGCAMPEMHGVYFFSDYCSGNLWSFEWDGTTKNNFQLRNAELDPGNQIGFGVVSFGEDAYGEMYIVEQNEIWKIERELADQTIEILPPSTHEVSPGGTFEYQIRASNRLGSAVQVEGWIDVVDADGNPLPFRANPVFGPKTKTLAGGAIIVKTVRLRIPASADPSGPWFIRAALGDFNSTTYSDTACLGFHIVP